MFIDSSGADNRTTTAISQLLSCIFSGEFQVGDHLTEASLAEKFGTSRTPVREALVELRGLGLLEVRRNRGALFNGFSAERLREIYEVRRLLEVEATRKATPRIAPERLQGLLRDTRRLHDSQADDEDWQLDRQIHSAIAEDCGNHMLTHDIQRFTTLVQAIRMTVGARIHVQQKTTEEHLEVLTAMSEGDANAAADAMRSHLENAEESAVAAIVDW